MQYIVHSPAEAAQYLLRRCSPDAALSYARDRTRGETVRGPAFWSAVVAELTALVPGLAPTAKSSTRDRLRDSIAAHPEWRQADHARALGVSHTRIQQLLDKRYTRR